MKTNVALVCMTKNGRDKIPRLLSSVQGLIDLAFFLDTSDDGGATAKWLQNPALMPYPIFVRQAQFTDFASTRNELQRWAQAEALQHADQTWFLLLDDDMALREDVEDGFKKLKAGISANKIVDAYLLKHAEPMEYWVTRLVRAEHDWVYKGVTHEVLTPNRFTLKAEGVSVLHFHDYNAEKFDRDIKLLSEDIARDPNDPRTIFYLANSFRDKGETAAAIRFFVMRAQMGGWLEEKYVAMYEAARLSNDPNLMEKAFNFRPTRAEPAYWLRNYYIEQDEQTISDKWEAIRAAIPESPDILFVHKGAYGPAAYTEYARRVTAIGSTAENLRSREMERA